MDWKNILKIDCYKLLIIIILLLMPLVSPASLGDEYVGDQIHLGLPLPYMQLDYIMQDSNLFIRPTGSYQSFIFDIVIAYLIGVLIPLVYCMVKNKKK